MDAICEQIRMRLCSIRAHVVSLLYSFKQIGACAQRLPHVIDSAIYDYLCADTNELRAAVIRKVVLTDCDALLGCKRDIAAFAPKILRYISKRLVLFINGVREHQDAKQVDERLRVMTEFIEDKLQFQEGKALQSFDFVSYIGANVVEMKLNKTFFKKDFMDLMGVQDYYNNLEALMSDFDLIKKDINSFNESVEYNDSVVLDFITADNVSFKEPCNPYTTVGLVKMLIEEKVNIKSAEIVLSNKNGILNNKRLITDYSSPFMVLRNTGEKLYFKTPNSNLSKKYSIDKTIGEIKKDLEINLKKEVDIILDYEYIEDNVKISSLDVEGKKFIVEYASNYKFVLPDNREIQLQLQHFQTFYDVYQKLYLNYLDGKSFFLYINDIRFNNFEKKVCDVKFDFIVVRFAEKLSAFILFPNYEIHQLMFKRNNTIQDVKKKISKRIKKNFIISVDNKKLMRLLIPVSKVIGEKNVIIKVNKIEDELINIHLQNGEIFEFSFNKKIKVSEFKEYLKTQIKCDFEFIYDNINDDRLLCTINPPVLNLEIKEQEYTIFTSDGETISLKLSPTSQIRDLKQTIIKVCNFENNFNIEVDDKVINPSTFLFKIEPTSKIQLKNYRDFKISFEKAKTVEKTVSLSISLTINELKSMISKYLQVDILSISILQNDKHLPDDLVLKEIQDDPFIRVTVSSKNK